MHKTFLAMKFGENQNHILCFYVVYILRSHHATATCSEVFLPQITIPLHKTTSRFI